MNSVNKTLYIPLYGKAYVSRKGLFLYDKKAEEIWKAEGFSLTEKCKEYEKNNLLQICLGFPRVDGFPKREFSGAIKKAHPERAVLMGSGVSMLLQR